MVLERGRKARGYELRHSLPKSFFVTTLRFFQRLGILCSGIDIFLAKVGNSSQRRCILRNGPAFFATALHSLSRHQHLLQRSGILRNAAAFFAAVRHSLSRHRHLLQRSGILRSDSTSFATIADS
jgi:hypothetical protein